MKTVEFTKWKSSISLLIKKKIEYIVLLVYPWHEFSDYVHKN